MEEKDLPFVCAIEKASFPNPWRETTFLGEINDRHFSFPWVIIHKVEKKIIGYIIFWHIKEGVQISNIAIHPDFRRMGIGETVLRQVMDQVRRKGEKFVTLEVRPSNRAALSLYQKLGFEILAIMKDYYSYPQEHALVMRKRLN